jgi:hypothetical protein
MVNFKTDGPLKAWGMASERGAGSTARLPPAIWINSNSRAHIVFKDELSLSTLQEFENISIIIKNQH